MRNTKKTSKSSEKQKRRSTTAQKTNSSTDAENNDRLHRAKPAKKTRSEVKEEKRRLQEQKNAEYAHQKEIESMLFTQDWCPVDDITLNMIRIKKKYGGGYVRILEVEPINFLLQSPDERADVISGMYEWLKVAPSNLQFKMTSTKTDVSGLIRSVQKRTANEKDPVVIERTEKYIEKIKNLSLAEGLSKRFYIVFKYEGNENGEISTDEQEISSVMQKTATEIEYFLSRVGNNIVHHGDPEDPYAEEMFMGNLLYRTFNPKSCINESFESRYNRIHYDRMMYDEYQGKEPDYNKMTTPDFLAPRGFNRSFRDYVVMDGMYMTFLYVRSDGYRHSVFSGWMENFTEFGEGVDISLYSKKLDHYKMSEEAGRTVRLKRSEAKDRTTSDENQEVLLSGADNAMFVQRMMNDNGEDMYDVCILISISAYTLKELLDKTNRITRILKSRSYLVEDCYLHEEGALMMSLPLLLSDKWIFNMAHRNMLTSSLASTYFFTAYELYDENGYLLGVNSTNSSLAVADIFNTRKYKNANIVVVGTSGMGKTFLLQELGYSLRESGVPVFYVLPYKGFEYKKACESIDGEYIYLAPGSKDCINIMAIRPKKEFDSDVLDEDIHEQSLLAEKSHQIVTFIQLLKPKQEMTDSEEIELNVVLTKLYAKFDITDDNESIWLDKDRKILKDMPILEDLYKACMKDKILQENVAVALRPFVEGTCQNMNGQTNVNLDNKYTVFDVSDAGDRFRAAFAFIAIDCAYDTIKGDRTENCALIMDEVWKMMINKYCAEYVVEIFRIIRGYGGSAIAASQDISDFMSQSSGDYGRKVISNSRIKFVLGAEKSELEALSESIDITDSELKQLSKFERGQALMIANGEKVPINIKGTREEIKIFTTDARTLRRIREDEQAAKQGNV